MILNRTRTALHCSLDFPKIVTPDAEIFQSARAGSVGDVQRLLSLAEADARVTTPFGTTLLHSASKSGNVELVRLLIREGADTNAQDEDGESPLHGAMARSDNYDVVRTLVENGADLSSKAIDGKTPLHSIFNNTIYHILMRDNVLQNMLPDSEGVVSYLVGQVSLGDLEKKDIQGRTPVHYATESSRAAGIIETLVDKGCDIYAVDNTGRNALHWAARWNNVQAVKKLIAIVGEEPFIVPDAVGQATALVQDFPSF
ncbi:MAG: hypothetical protein Q9184_007327 [Pyrenodesmia sp. 2 TL-2023]